MKTLGRASGLPQPPGLGDGALGVVGQVGVDLQADEAVRPPSRSYRGRKRSAARCTSVDGQGLVDRLMVFAFRAMARMASS